MRRSRSCSARSRSSRATLRISTAWVGPISSRAKLDLADPPLTEAADKLKDSSVVQDHLGDLRFKQRRFADAAAAWERALGGDGQSIDQAQKSRARFARLEAGCESQDLPAPCSPQPRHCFLRATDRRAPVRRRHAISLITRPPTSARPTHARRCARLVAVLSISGSACRQRLRAKLDAGFEAPSRVRLELPAPGKPIFTLRG